MAQVKNNNDAPLLADNHDTRNGNKEVNVWTRASDGIIDNSFFNDSVFISRLVPAFRGIVSGSPGTGIYSGYTPNEGFGQSLHASIRITTMPIPTRNFRNRWSAEVRYPVRANVNETLALGVDGWTGDFILENSTGLHRINYFERRNTGSSAFRIPGDTHDLFVMVYNQNMYFQSLSASFNVFFETIQIK